MAREADRAILLQDVDPSCARGDVVSVKSGYLLNYLVRGGSPSRGDRARSPRSSRPSGAAKQQRHGEQRRRSRATAHTTPQPPGAAARRPPTAPSRRPTSPTRSGARARSASTAARCSSTSRSAAWAPTRSTSRFPRVWRPSNDGVPPRARRSTCPFPRLSSLVARPAEPDPSIDPPAIPGRRSARARGRWTRQLCAPLFARRSTASSVARCVPAAPDHVRSHLRSLHQEVRRRLASPSALPAGQSTPPAMAVGSCSDGLAGRATEVLSPRERAGRTSTLGGQTIV